MTIDELSAAIKAYCDIAEPFATDERLTTIGEGMQAAIEAVEAARPEPNQWRPLSEADIQEREKIEIWSKKGWWIAHWFTGVDGERYWRCGPDDIWTPEQLVAAVFRTIDPPPQDGARSGVSTSPAAGTGS